VAFFLYYKFLILYNQWVQVNYNIFGSLGQCLSSNMIFSLLSLLFTSLWVFGSIYSRSSHNKTWILIFQSSKVIEIRTRRQQVVCQYGWHVVCLKKRLDTYVWVYRCPWAWLCMPLKAWFYLCWARLVSLAS
jgi:hypothetical protein